MSRVSNLLIKLGLLKEQPTIITPYYFGANELTEYIACLTQLESEGADIAYCKFDEGGGVIEVKHHKL